MRAIGVVLIGVGLALLLFTLFGFFYESGKIISPIPENKGVKVIFVSPTK